MKTSAVISTCGRYRYALERSWATGKRRAVFVMLNPSTADAEEDDPTIRKCIGFAKRWGLDGITVVNLYAWRATDPMAMWAAAERGEDIVGRHNAHHIARAIVGPPHQHAGERVLVAAWGASIDHPRARRAGAAARADGIVKMLGEHGAVCLGRSAAGFPRHPLMLAYSTERDLLEHVLECDMGEDCSCD